MKAQNSTRNPRLAHHRILNFVGASVLFYLSLFFKCVLCFRVVSCPSSFFECNRRQRGEPKDHWYSTTVAFAFQPSVAFSCHQQLPSHPPTHPPTGARKFRLFMPSRILRYSLWYLYFNPVLTSNPFAFFLWVCL